MDALELLTGQHREVDEAMQRLERLGPSDRACVDRIHRFVDLLEVHVRLEQTIFYPTVRRALPDRREEIDHQLEELAGVQELLRRLRQGRTVDEVDRSLGEVAAAVRRHVERGERGLFTVVGERFGQGALRDMALVMTRLMPAMTPPEPPVRDVGGLLDPWTAGVYERLQRVARDGAKPAGHLARRSSARLPG